jgi:hypothetical protein
VKSQTSFRAASCNVLPERVAPSLVAFERPAPEWRGMSDFLPRIGYGDE